MVNVTRRNFLGKSMKYGLGAGFVMLGGAGLAACAPEDNKSSESGGSGGGSGKAKHIVKIGLDDPEGHPHVAAAKKYAEIVSEKTNGDVKVEVYPSSQLGNAADVIEGLNHGTVEAFFGAVTWLGASLTDFWLPGTLYLFKDQEHSRKVHESDQFRELADKIQSQKGIRVLSMSYDRGPRHIISESPVKTLNDFKGLEVRVPPQKSWVRNFELAGAAPQAIPISETFTGLQQGIIAATEQASNWLYFNKYYTIAENVTKTYHNYEQAGMFFSEQVFSTYPKDVQKILTEASDEIVSYHNDLMEEDIVNSEKKMKDEGVVFHEVDLNKWETFFKDLIPKLSEEIGYTPALVDSILKG